MVNSWLFQRLSEFKDETAIIWQDQKYSYRQILDGVLKWYNILEEYGIKQGESVAIYGDFSPNVTCLILSLIKNNNIAVPLTSSMFPTLEDCLKIARATCLFEFNDSDSFNFRRINNNPDHPLLEDLRKNNDSGLIIFTSGSTGEMKAALHSFTKVISKFKKKGQPFVTLAFLLFDHIGGINTLFGSLTSCGKIILGVKREPEFICKMIEQYKVNLLGATPTFLKILLMSDSYKKYNLSSLKLITYGTEPMTKATLDTLNTTFPDVKFKQLYGLSESGVLPTKSENSGSLNLVVGGEGCEAKVIDGIIYIKTDFLMIGYLNAPSPSVDSDGWYRTGDMAEIKANGNIRILGRESELINVGGEKVFPAEVENVIMQMYNIKDVIVRGKPNPVTGHIVYAKVEIIEPEDPDKIEVRVRKFCAKHLPQYKIPAVVEISNTNLHNGRFKKIRRVV
ncbi:MAG: acyl--CoA ligase [Desulfobacterales bacterium]|nr:acyl--CoA ligase [Desulfobacterales bacterium]MBF0397286.1 acyl--CoA ligase [Desulfobacterales bacterium]